MPNNRNEITRYSDAYWVLQAEGFSKECTNVESSRYRSMRGFVIFTVGFVDLEILLAATQQPRIILI